MTYRLLSQAHTHTHMLDTMTVRYFFHFLLRPIRVSDFYRFAWYWWICVRARTSINTNTATEKGSFYAYVSYMCVVYAFCSHMPSRSVRPGHRHCSHRFAPYMRFSIGAALVVGVVVVMRGDKSIKRLRTINRALNIYQYHQIHPPLPPPIATTATP